MSDILRYKSIVAVCLCFIFVFSFFAFTFQRSEAIATIPLVAVPIIKLLIASGVTFLSVDAMLEVYNRMKGTDYYNTLTGNLLNMLDDVSDDLVSAWLFHDWAMEQPDPPGSGWPEWPELLLGTLCLEIAKSDNFFQDFLNWFNGFKNDLDSGITTIIEDSFDLSEIEEAKNYYHNKYYFLTGDTDIYCSIGNIPLHIRCRVHENGSSICPWLGIPDYYDYKSFTGFCCRIHNPTYGGRYNTAILRIDSLYFSDNGTYYRIGFNATTFLDKANDNSYYISSGNALFNIYKDNLPVVEIGVDDELLIEISDNNFQNDEKEKVEIYVPIPNEIVTYNPETGLDIDFDTEISIEEFTELMTPYVGSTWEDIQQDKPIPSKVPTDVPYPEDPVVPDPVVPPAPVPDEDDLPPDADEGDDPFAGADEGKTIDWDPLKGIGLHKKFPFCIPWDLYDSFKTFNVEGEAPRWEVEFLGDTEFVIDFVQFEEWARIVRWGVLILFNLGLILITRNIIRG